MVDTSLRFVAEFRRVELFVDFLLCQEVFHAVPPILTPTDITSGMNFFFDISNSLFIQSYNL